MAYKNLFILMTALAIFLGYFSMVALGKAKSEASQTPNMMGGAFSCEIPKTGAKEVQADCSSKESTRHRTSGCHECAGAHCHENHLAGKKTSQVFLNPFLVSVRLISSETIPLENNLLETPYRPPSHI